MSFSVVIEPEAIIDIQQAIDYYEEQKAGLGSRFENLVHQNLESLQHNPYFRIFYNNVRCLPMQKFPYLIHFTVSEKEELVIIRAVLHSARESKF